MSNQAFCGRLLTVKDGYLVCPVCKQNKRVHQITLDMYCIKMPCFCRRCKAEFKADVKEGQCFESRSQ